MRVVIKKKGTECRQCNDKWGQEKRVRGLGPTDISLLVETNARTSILIECTSQGMRGSRDTRANIPSVLLYSSDFLSIHSSASGISLLKSSS